MSRVGGGALDRGVQRDGRAVATYRRLNQEENKMLALKQEILGLIDRPLGASGARVLKINLSMQVTTGEPEEGTGAVGIPPAVTKIVVNSWIANDNVVDATNAADLTIFMAHLTMQHVHRHTKRSEGQYTDNGIEPFDSATSLVKGLNEEPIFTEAVSTIKKDRRWKKRKIETFYDGVIKEMFADMRKLGLLFFGRKKNACIQRECRSYELYFVEASTVGVIDPDAPPALPMPPTTEVAVLDAVNSLLDTEVACAASLLTPFE